MDIAEVEQLLDIFREARVSELTVSAGTPQTTIKLKKPLPAATQQPVQARQKKGTIPQTAQPVSAPEQSTASYITAPMVGIFHSLDSITAVGSAIRAGQVVGSIESMKLMNDIVAERDGVIVEAFIEDGMPVEYGHRLFRIE